MAQNGIIFFENGEVQMFGTLNTVRMIATSIQQTLPSLIAQEREQLVQSITADEFKALVDARSKNASLEDDE